MTIYSGLICVYAQIHEISLQLNDVCTEKYMDMWLHVSANCMKGWTMYKHCVPVWLCPACVLTSCLRSWFTTQRGNPSRRGVLESSAECQQRQRDRQDPGCSLADSFLRCHYLWLASMPSTLWQARQTQVSDRHTHARTHTHSYEPCLTSANMWPHFTSHRWISLWLLSLTSCLTRWKYYPTAKV